MADIIGTDRAKQVVNEGMTLISLGGNDFVNNYYLIPFSARSREYSLPDYVRYIVSEYRKVLYVILFPVPSYCSLYICIHTKFSSLTLIIHVYWNNHA